MEKIKITNNNENVTIKITIDYSGPSKYIYHATPEKSFSYESSRIPPVNYPHPHPIGIANILTGPDYRENNWDIELLNPSDNELEYSVKIEWFQGNSDNPIYTWPQKEEDQKGKVKANSHGPDFSTNCRYKY